MMYACACVPLTSMPVSFPASTFDVPSNPPMKAYLPGKGVGIMIIIKVKTMKIIIVKTFYATKKHTHTKERKKKSEMRIA